MPSKMTREERAEYQREYRKRQRREQGMNTTMPAQAVRELIDAEDRIKVLEGEVRQLKRELAGRPKSYSITSDPYGVTIDPPPAEGSRVTVRAGRIMGEGIQAVAPPVRFGTPRPAPKPVSRKR